MASQHTNETIATDFQKMKQSDFTKRLDDIQRQIVKDNKSIRWAIIILMIAWGIVLVIMILQIIEVRHMVKEQSQLRTDIASQGVQMQLDESMVKELVTWATLYSAETKDSINKLNMATFNQT